ncbi:hypothetical protein DFA_11637 [Cavenderia fasciculata]|uniref:Protein kinase domain-containing protein n=1 Tax=Cavenderia fasciculata TaxID=261658 RepID=F4QDS9_CACFS|nr:uncharacterized protein DFA_11637 [Cavenderia fasciculata]EGG13876.1 hypothetical protein DFA_11637 [Cavenderia fasciculata]|eukprot:XP_004350584.1 hypothetical protein DFA_11637 [Cavenderia fasciculata]
MNSYEDQLIKDIIQNQFTEVIQLTPKTIFLSYNGVLTITYKAWTNGVTKLKDELNQSSLLAEENMGTKWPKTTIACLKDNVNLTYSQYLQLSNRVEQLSNQFFANNDLKTIDMSNLSLVSFHNRALISPYHSITQFNCINKLDYQQSGGGGGLEGAGNGKNHYDLDQDNVTYVQSVINEPATIGHEQYYQKVQSQHGGNLHHQSYYVDPVTREKTLVCFLNNNYNNGLLNNQLFIKKNNNNNFCIIKMSSFFKNYKDYLHNWYYNPSLDQILYCTQDEKNKVQQVFDLFSTNKNHHVSQTIIHPIESIEYLTLNQIHHLLTTYRLRVNSDMLVKCIRDLELHFINTFKVTTKNKKTRALELELLNSIVEIDEKTIGYHKCLYNVAGKIMDGSKGKYDLVFILVMTEIGTTYQKLFKKGEDCRIMINKEMDSMSRSKRFQVCKAYTQLWAHFYTFATLIQEFHLALASESKSPEASKNTLALKTLLKQLSKIKKYIAQQHSSTPYYLRIPSDDNPEQVLILAEKESIISTMSVSPNTSSSSSAGSGQLASKIKFNYSQFTLYNQIHNDTKNQSTHLHYITSFGSSSSSSSSSSNELPIDMYIKTTMAPIKEIISIYHSFLNFKSIKCHQCNFCQLSTNHTIECSSCNINICILCTRNEKCIKCYLTHVPIRINVRLEGRENTPKLIILETPSYLDFNSQIFEKFDIDKGMRIQCKLQDHSRQDIPLNSDINLHLALRTNTPICKMVNVFVMDPRINSDIPTIGMSDLIFPENSHIAEGGGGTVSEVIIPTLSDYKDIPLVLKCYKLPVFDPEEFDPRSKINTIARSKYKFKREAALLSNIKSDYIIKMIAFVRDENKPHEMGIILEKAPLGSMDKKYFSSWELNILILLDICKSLKAVHSNGYIFQDLKPDNVLLFTESTDPEKIRCKLSDFGIVTKKKKKHNLGHTGVSHTFSYVAPEHNAKGKFNESIDIYAFGLLMFELLTTHRYLNRFGEPKYDFKDVQLPLPALTIIKLLLKTDVEMRLSSMQIVQEHLEKLLQTCKTENWQPLIHPSQIPLRQSYEDTSI